MSTEPVVLPSLTSGLDEHWLTQTHEDILEPELPICDPHHHLWERDGHRYLLPEFLADAGSGHHIESTVFLECGAFYRATGPVEMRSVGEAEFVNGVAAMSASGQYGPTRVAAAFVGYADLTLGERAEAVLTALIEAGGGRFRGVRHSAAWDEGFVIGSSHSRPPAELYLDSTFRQGFACLGRLGLSFDAWVYYPQIPDVIDLARSFPEQPIVLNHVGGPIGVGPYAGRREAEFPVWANAIRELARCDNVWMKLGALSSKRAGFGWHERAQPPSSEELATAWRPYIETCIEAFGVQRCMFESNFPVDKVSCSYAVLWNAFKRLAAGSSVSEKAALFRDTAHRFYRVAPST
ncbi:amidohydrolase family protein [Candidatus Entotheonella palauensis]|uniref:amidohydrolase family protein n=1 Tax=Candidatus Entotheonella palauensis TaxID=93172 RepID=UPI000B7D8720|nr:amidohydrolase family protein [Candidatus Entotheonella palauensis]